MNNLNRLLRWLAYAAAVVAVLPVLPFLAGWVQLLLGGSFVAGILQDHTRRLPVLGKIGAAVALVAVLLFVSRISLHNVVDPLVHILCLLLAARLGGDKTPRDILQIFLLSMTILAASSLLTLNMLYLLYLVVMIALLGSGLILLAFVHTDPAMHLSAAAFKELRRFIRLIPAGTLVLMCGFFLILPRTPVPLWNILSPRPEAIIGMTDQVQLGSFSDLAGSGKVAFRAEMAELPAQSLYWRGIVLNQLDGDTWSRGPESGRDSFRVDPQAVHEYVIYAEPRSDRFLVTLDRTVSVRGVAHRQEHDGLFIRNAQDHKRTNYRGQAHLQENAAGTGDLSGYLAVPAAVPSPLRDVAHAIAVDARSYEDRVAGLTDFFLAQRLSYSSTNLPRSESPLETFLFESRQGYCEYFASSFAVLLRLLDIPARLVGGYLGGNYNRFGSFYLVGEDQAHVWVEALDDEGIWRRIDPSRLAINAELALLSGMRQRLTLQHVGDALFHYWSRTVLNYDLRQQFQLFRETSGFLAQIPRVSLSEWSFWVWMSLPAVLFSLLLVVRRKYRPAALIESYQRRVARCAGLKSLPPGMGLYHLAQQTNDPLCRQFAEIYGAAMYADHPLSASDRRNLRRIIRRLKGRRLRIGVALPATLDDNGSLVDTTKMPQPKGQADAVH